MFKRLKNWKTSSLGIGTLLTAIGSIIANPAAVDWGTAIPAIISAISLLFAKD